MSHNKIKPLLQELRRHTGYCFPLEAYLFVLEALDYTIYMQGHTGGPLASSHITPDELLKGIQRYADDEFGSMASFTFNSWGVTETADFGTLVFDMCAAGLLNKTETDKQSDFANGFDFKLAFANNIPPSQL
ncbi:MAG: hypothetical protein OSB63_04275 [Planctomycetota bacterium]|jgi:uncharacterized repeat protein (TIGR04138 family)|nr:hypothetical protein [Planctomycetota bacterium]